MYWQLYLHGIVEQGCKIILVSFFIRKGENVLFWNSLMLLKTQTCHNSFLGSPAQTQGMLGRSENSTSTVAL